MPLSGAGDSCTGAGRCVSIAVGGGAAAAAAAAAAGGGGFGDVAAATAAWLGIGGKALAVLVGVVAILGDIELREGGMGRPTLALWGLGFEGMGRATPGMGR